MLSEPEHMEEGSDLELTDEQVGALLSYFGIESGDTLEAIQRGVQNLSFLQRS